MSKFKVGDVLQIRQWDDMSAEFGECGGFIGCLGGFYDYMRHLCGEIFTVKEIRRSSYAADRYISVEGVENDGGITPYWYISEDMLEQIQSEININILDERRLDDFLNAFQVNI